MHWFLDPIKNHYFDFEGRVSRKPFWMFVLGMLIVGVVVGMIATAINMPLLSTLYSLALLLPSIGITARRLHDTDLSGWIQLVGIIPVLGLIIMIVLCARPGTAGANKYGADPRGGEAAMPNADAAAAAPDAGMPTQHDVVAETPQPTADENQQQGYGN